MSTGEVALIDLRESKELKQGGKIPGAVHAPRGMLEFYADETLPYHKKEFQKEKRIILHCASGGRSGWLPKRSSKWDTKMSLVLTEVSRHWKEAGIQTE